MKHDQVSASLLDFIKCLCCSTNELCTYIDFQNLIHIIYIYFVCVVNVVVAYFTKKILLKSIKNKKK